MAQQPGGGPRGRTVVLLIGVLVVLVLGVSVVSALLPGLDGLLASLPVVILGLVLGTLVILAGVLRR